MDYPEAAEIIPKALAASSSQSNQEKVKEMRSPSCELPSSSVKEQLGKLQSADACVCGNIFPIVLFLVVEVM